MGVWSLSLLILSLTLLMYRHPPSTWRASLQTWLQGDMQEGLKKGDEYGEKGSMGGTKAEGLKEEQTSDNRIYAQGEPSEDDEDEGKDEDEEDDDKTPQAKPTAPEISVPSFTLDDAEEETLPAPTFPAANSIQRVSNPTPPPATPSVSTAAPSTPSLSMPPPPKPPTTTTKPASSTSTLMPPPTSTSVQRISSSSLMPPPRGPPPSRPSPSASLRVPPTSSRNPPLSPAARARAPPAPRIDTPKSSRSKVQLQPGFSPLDWAALSTSKNLSGVPTLLRVTPSLLSRHNGRKGNDAWSAYKGKVYNVSPYAGFHPGGKGELFRGAGRDATVMFEEVHPWVNWEGMLGGSCLVGVLVSESEGDDGLDGLD